MDLNTVENDRTGTSHGKKLEERREAGIPLNFYMVYAQFYPYYHWHCPARR